MILRSTILVLIITSFCMTGLSQQKKTYGPKTISQWTFEKFPLHYSVTPTKTFSDKNVKTKKLEVYYEVNNLGQDNGLRLIMRADGINPSSATYTYKGQIVYMVSFFPGSKTAESITSYNQEGQLDGYKVWRELKTSGGYTEKIEKFQDGFLVEVNGVKQAAFAMNFKDSLLNGRFKFEHGYGDLIEGEAIDGKLKYVKRTRDGLILNEIIFGADSVKVRKADQYYDKGIIKYYTYILDKIPVLTNSKSVYSKNENPNLIYYLIEYNTFEITIIEDKLIRY